MRWRIRYQLLAPLLTLLLGVAGVSTWTAVASARRAWQQLDTRFRSIAHTLAESSFPLGEPILEQLKGLSEAEYLLVRSDGRRHATFPAAAVQLPPAEVVVDDWQDLRLGPSTTLSGEEYFCSGLRLYRPPERAGAVLYILYPEARWRDVLWEAIWPSLILGGSIGLASLALALSLGQGLSRRIRELERRTRLIAAGNFTPLPLFARNDELRDLGRSINEMAGQLAQLQETVQKTERLRLLGQVSGGLAHQLRNGVTGARLAVQLHARECDGHADAETLEVALRQLALVEANLKRFLDLGRTGEVRRRPCSLGALLDETVALLRPQCRHAGIELRWQRPAPDCVLSGDAGRLGQLFLNVVSNAVEAAGPGGTVEVGLQKADGAVQTGEGPVAVVAVRDSGPGPPPEVAGRLFEPFVTGKAEGVGLGLAVSRQVAEEHGGRIGWHREAGRTCFRIELPLALARRASEG
jgi:signal transduction histidine kinase